MALAGISSWQSVADSIKHKPETASQLMIQLNEYLSTRAFLIPSSQCTLADMDLALVLGNAMKKDTNMTELPHFNRWMQEVQAVLEEYAALHDIKIPALEIQAPVVPMPVFFNGTEEYVPPKVTDGTKKQQAASNNKDKAAAPEKHAKRAEQKKANQENTTTTIGG
jgi:hypothetical protein